jgi:hypothetical protein
MYISSACCHTCLLTIIKLKPPCEGLILNGYRWPFAQFSVLKMCIGLWTALCEDGSIFVRDRLKMWQFFSNEVSFIWLRPPTHPLQMKMWKTEYRCIINQTPPNNIGFRTMYSPYACHDKGSIYESLSFQNHRHLISSKCTYNSTNILYQ